MAGFPDFLLIGGGRSGTAWLRTALARHPGVNVGPDHEIHYFTKDWEERPLRDYCRSFDESGQGLRGDFTPATALLPAHAIRAIHRLNPRIKILYAMRNPVDHAWALARHYIRFRGFAFGELEQTGTLTVAMLMRFFVSDFAIASSDHASVLERWSSVVPRENIFVYVMDRAVSEQMGLLAEVQRFLELDPVLDPARLVPPEPVNVGLPERLPDFLKPWLRTLWRRRTVRLASLLQSRFGLALPADWQTDLQDSVIANDQLLFEGARRYMMKGGAEDGGLFFEPDTGEVADYVLDLHLAQEWREGGGWDALDDWRQARILREMNADLFFQPMAGR
jgi:hypothetical protein